MIILKHIPDPNNKFDTDTVIFKTESVTLTEILQTFEFFLKGCGFSFKGTLGIVEDDDETI